MIEDEVPGSVAGALASRGGVDVVGAKVVREQIGAVAQVEMEPGQRRLRANTRSTGRTRLAAARDFVALERRWAALITLAA
jgi:hypothetical protein